MSRVYLLRASGFLAYGALFGSVAAIARDAPSIPLIIFISAFIVGFVQDKKILQNPISNPLYMIPLIIAGIVISVVGINSDNFFNRVLSILLIIISAKLISPKKSRDMLQIYLLNLLMVSASAVTRWGLEFGLLVILETFISVTGLIFIYGSSEQQELSFTQALHLTRWSSLITLGLIPCTIIFFLIIPRPTWTLFAWGGGAVAKSGFSDQVKPGDVAEIKNDTSPAFRVKWLEGRVPQRPLWRGIVFDSYHKGGWEKRFKREVDLPIHWGESVKYEIVLEPTESEYLLSLGLPGKISIKSLKPVPVSGFTINVPDGIKRRILYRARSYLPAELPADLSPAYYREIPKEIQEQLAPLAASLIGETDLNTARSIESFLKTNFSYDLSPGEARGDPVIYFLFTNRKGHCEYFASSMALLLRSLDIPARVVGGYLGGDWNDLGRYYLVHQSDAHTWVEAWIEDRGWVTFDPTPEVVSKERSQVVAKLFRLFDFLRLKWYYWVIDYDLGRQLDLARKTASLFRSFRAGERKQQLSRKITGLKKSIPLFLLFLGIAIFLKFAWFYFHARPKGWGERFVSSLRKSGHHKEPGETLREFANRVNKQDSCLGHKALQFVDNYYPLEYGQQGDEKSLAQLLKDMKRGE